MQSHMIEKKNMTLLIRHAVFILPLLWIHVRFSSKGTTFKKYGSNVSELSYHCLFAPFFLEDFQLRDNLHLKMVLSPSDRLVFCLLTEFQNI